MAHRSQNSDLIELLSYLADEKVKFLIVGGHAVAKYGEPRYTKDVDIWIDNSRQNAIRVFNALKKFGAPVSSISADFFTFEDQFLKLGKEPLRVDIICGMEALSFKDAWNRKVKGVLFGEKVFFISLKHLVTLKKHAARPQDLADVASLLKLNKK
jgi:predicted nucleotidyltransferase